MNGQLYKILRVSPTADASAIRKAYRQTALLVHPDKGGSEKLFHLVAVAFETLSNKASREAYDARNGIRCRPTPLKRSWSQWDMASGPSLKRPRRVKAKERDSAPKPSQQRTCGAVAVQQSRRARVFGRLRTVLQSLDAAKRREAMEAMEPQVQRALLVHMQIENHGAVTLSQKENSTHNMRRNDLLTGSCVGLFSDIFEGRLPPKSGVAGIHKVGQLYRASVAVANMELYGRIQASLAVAIDDHIILSQMKECIKKRWACRADDEDILSTCRRCLEDNQMSEEELELRAKVRVRAGNWIGPMRISSPALPLAEAIPLRSKLLSSRRLSWQSFRTECISLLQHRKCFLGKQTSRTTEEATAIADKAWTGASSRRQIAELASKRLLERVVRDATAVLQSEKRRAEKVKERLQAVEKRRTLREHRQSREELRRWSRRRDLTMDEILRGPPSFRPAT